MRTLILLKLFIACCIFNTPTNAQQYAQLNSFTTKEGLPSNHIYDAVEDSKGFLWVATDNGLSQFDGKYFKNFSTQNGLPSNDVIQVLKDGSGTLWANCYKQPPSYFDEINNTFIVLKGNEAYNQRARHFGKFFLLENGTVNFTNNIINIILGNKKIISFKITDLRDKGNQEFGITPLIDNEKIINLYTTLPPSNKLYFKLKGQSNFTDSLAFGKLGMVNSCVFNNQLYNINDKGLLCRWQHVQVAPLRFQKDSVQLSNQVIGYKFNTIYLYANTNDNHVFLVHRNTLATAYNITVPHIVNNTYIDTKQNLWVCTLDKGMLLYSKNGISTLPIPANKINPNFLSICSNTAGTLLVGNYNGEVLKIDKQKFTKITLPKVGSFTWVRKVFFIKNKIVSACDDVINIDGKLNILAKPFGVNSFISVKTSVVINDSIILLGNIAGLHKLNINNKSITALQSKGSRIFTIVKNSNRQIYYLTVDGLYRYNYIQNLLTPIPLTKLAATETLNLIAIAPNGYLWVLTSFGNFIVLKNEQEQQKIAFAKNVLPNNITTLFAYKNEMWMGSKTGIAVATYTENGGQINAKLKFLTIADGLPSNTVNDFTAIADTVYAATENGIAVIPANYTYNVTTLVPTLTNIKVNNEDYPLSQNFNLQSHQKNIALTFATVELTGHFKQLLYAVDGQKKFEPLYSNTLNLQLTGGEHFIYVKAADNNNSPNQTVYTIRIAIKIPIYENIWFWLLLTIIGTACIFWYTINRKLNKQKIIFAQQQALQNQQQKITADLHDDIGASLSSLQVNSAVAAALIDKDSVQEAKIVLQKIENQSRDLSEKIGDIIWSMKPGKDEFISLSGRIKNFTNDILGSSQIAYKITTDKEIDEIITNVNMRKNILFIAKEAINNAVKYSEATFIQIELLKRNNEILFSVVDNGKGFSITNISGNGISNIKRRVHELNGSFNLSSNTKGTTISFKIPIN